MEREACITELITLLEEAVALSSQYTGGYSNQFFSAEEFHEALKTTFSEFKNGNMNALNDLWGYFAPTCSWDDFIRHDGIELGHKIYTLVNDLKT